MKLDLDALERVATEVREARNAKPFDPQRWFAALRAYDEVFDADTDGQDTVLALIALVRRRDDDEADAKEMASFLVGWWPGLEDAISWGDSVDEHPAHRAAQRWRARRAKPKPPEPVEATFDDDDEDEV